MATKKSKSGLAAVPREKRWEIEHDLEMMMHAEKVKADPKRFKLVQELAKEKMVQVASVVSESD